MSETLVTEALLCDLEKLHFSRLTVEECGLGRIPNPRVVLEPLSILSEHLLAKEKTSEISE